MDRIIDRLSQTLATPRSRKGFLSALGKAALAGAAVVTGVGITDAFAAGCGYCCGVGSGGGSLTCLQAYGQCGCPANTYTGNAFCCTYAGKPYSYQQCLQGGTIVCIACYQLCGFSPQP